MLFVEEDKKTQPFTAGDEGLAEARAGLDGLSASSHCFHGL
jgi:hypothetical protein